MDTHAPIGDVRGWLSSSEAGTLIKLAEGKNVLEIGTFGGLSTLYMARVAKKVVTVDRFFGGLFEDPAFDGENGQDTLAEAWENLKRYKSTDVVSIVTGRLEDVVDYLDVSTFDLIFYDAEHTYESTKKGIDLLKNRVRLDCAWAFHDYGSSHGVQKSVDEFLNEYIDKNGFIPHRYWAASMFVMTPHFFDINEIIPILF
jgi:hypothetical protein